MNTTRDTLSLDEATRRIRVDHDLLLTRVERLSEQQLTAEYHVLSGPLGDFCESLHDLVAHVLMWDEINLAVLSEAVAGRSHWSLDPRWETPDAGRRLNRGGVAAGRHIPSPLLLHRLVAVRDALMDEFARYSERSWAEPGETPVLADGLGELARKVWTVPGHQAFWHAAIHLDQLTQAAATQ
ncbi:DinB family protein [Micromonospora kangleipakensis]|uniref:DinB family protein n=1 Tax=Micromonospora kangleipakensis TaxID=1077942 RepID=A0A4Q8BE53_9ACTN|nr:DinB family protein [Micromonospora kangleipakensis]RZU76200.1 DinB family protein [Micromonospora kangleipakensis]